MIDILAFVDECFEELELLYPVIRLREAGCQVVIGGAEKGRSYAGKHGYPCVAEVSLTELQGDRFDAVLIPGGFAPDKLRRSQDVLRIVRQINEAGKVVGCICHGGWVPISAGIVKGREMTGTVAIKDDILNAGAIWKDEPVVIDGNLVSSRTPKDLPEYSKALLKVLRL